MSTATNGRAREYRVRDHMIDRNWIFVARSAGSKGACDLVMAHPFLGVALVQVGTKSKALSPLDRDRFVSMAEVCSALPLLATCVPRKPPVFHVVTRDTASKWEGFHV